MSIKLRILALQIALSLVLVLMAAIAVTAISAVSAKLQQVQWSHQQMAAALQLEAAANNYAEQVAEILLVGESERRDLEGARTEITRLLNSAYDLARKEIDGVSAARQAEESDEIARLGQMQAIFQRSDRAVERLLLLNNEGRETEAILLFSSEIENRLDADLERLIATAIADERAEVQRTDAEAEHIARQLFWLTSGALAAALAAAILMALRFSRAIRVPLRALTEGANAIERGSYGHRVAVPRPDEFGELAGRFNAMAAELGHQRSELVGARARLELEVASRTSELGDANRRLLMLDEQRVRFLADVSHELRTPLTVLRGEAEVALRAPGGPDSETRASLELIVAQAAEMGRLIEDLLFLARSEADDLRFEFAEVDFFEVVRDAVNDATVIARHKEIRFAGERLSRNAIVSADWRRLKQAVLTVLDNAIKYAPPQGVIEIGLTENKDDIELVVANTGDALQDDELPNVFERFFRGQNARALGVGGSGLGLAIARRLVEKHGGQLTLSRQPDRRTRVTLRLPAVNSK